MTNDSICWICQIQLKCLNVDAYTLITWKNADFTFLRHVFPDFNNKAHKQIIN